MKEKQSENQQEFVRLDWRLTGRGEIPCQVSEGMLTSERIVTIETEETAFQFFIDESHVEPESQLKKLEKNSRLYKGICL